MKHYITVPCKNCNDCCVIRNFSYLINYRSGSFREHEDIYSIADDQLTALEHRSKARINVTKYYHSDFMY